MTFQARGCDPTTKRVFRRIARQLRHTAIVLIASCVSVRSVEWAPSPATKKHAVIHTDHENTVCTDKTATGPDQKGFTHSTKPLLVYPQSEHPGLPRAPRPLFQACSAGPSRTDETPLIVHTHSPRRAAAAVTSLSTDTDVFLIVVGGAPLIVCPRWGHTRGELLTYSVLRRWCPLTLGLDGHVGATVLMIISQRKEADVGVCVHGEHPQNSKRKLVLLCLRSW